MRVTLLIFGTILICLQQFMLPLSTQTQFIIFLIGIVLLGIPHGAADLLVGEKNAQSNNQGFSAVKFLFRYVGRLLLFAILFWLFPLLANVLFIFFAAYHFGETDLNQFKTNTFLGKLLVISYGLVILSIILLHHFEDVQTLFLQFKAGQQHIAVIDWISENRYVLMTISGALFFVATFLYFLKNSQVETAEKGLFIVHFAVIALILFNLPMLLGFTFYFVVWHSVLSLNNIVSYLRSNNRFSRNIIVRQIVFYSALAIVGIGLFGFTGSLLINSQSIISYVFLGLAVLTAPHMQIMYDMYNSLRNSSSTQ